MEVIDRGGAVQVLEIGGPEVRFDSVVNDNARLLVELDRASEAIERLEAFCASGRATASSWWLLVEIATNSGELALGLDICQSALQVFPNATPFLIHKYTLEFRLGWREAALEGFQKLITRNADRMSPFRRAMRLLHVSRDLDATQKFFLSVAPIIALESEDDAIMFGRMAIKTIDQVRLDELFGSVLIHDSSAFGPAIDLLRHILLRESASALPVVNCVHIGFVSAMIRCLIDEGRLDRAEQLVDVMQKYGFHSAAVQLCRFMSAVKRGGLSSVDSEFLVGLEEAISKSPDSTATWSRAFRDSGFSDGLLRLNENVVNSVLPEFKKVQVILRNSWYLAMFGHAAGARRGLELVEGRILDAMQQNQALQIADTVEARCYGSATKTRICRVSGYRVIDLCAGLIQVFHPKARHALVWFEGDTPDMESIVRSHCLPLLKQLDVTLVVVRDRQFLAGLGKPFGKERPNQLIKLLTKLLTSRFQKVITAGRSLAGYSAILNGLKLQAQGAIVFGAISYLPARRDALPVECGWAWAASQRVRSAIGEGDQLQLAQGLRRHPEFAVNLTIGEASAIDGALTQDFEGLANVCIHKDPHGSHDALQWLVSHGLFEERFKGALSALLADSPEHV